MCLSAWDKIWFVLQQLLIEELNFLRKRRSNRVIWLSLPEQIAKIYN